MQYYYEKPIYAALMCHIYGMKFGVKAGGEIFWNCSFTEIGKPAHPLNTVDLILSADADQFYIHPDCHGLLVPKFGDVLLNPDGLPAIVSNNGRDNTITMETALEFCGKEASIIGRGEQPFIWPETEE